MTEPPEEAPKPGEEPAAMAMDLGGDIVMGEAHGGVVGTTELNGHSGTVDPAVISLEPQAAKDSTAQPPSASASALSPSPLGLAAFARQTMAPMALMDTAMPDDVPSSEVESSESSVDLVDETEEEALSRRYVVEVVVPKPRAPQALPYSSSRSGLVYDPLMRFHSEPGNRSDDDIHPEDPRRIHEIYSELRNAGLVDDASQQYVPIDMQLWRIDARHAKLSELNLVHTKDHIKWVKSLENKTNDELNDLSNSLDSVYLHQLTYDCARLSAGGAIEACRAVVAGQIKNTIAVIRPPGHHAEHCRPGGFCFFNNVCIAARVCQQDFPQKCRKILILDWDVHHGNGVQEAFYSDPNVLYISIHVHKNGTFYPPGNYGDHKHCGEGQGLGFNINIPWTKHGMGDGDYLLAFQQIVMPIATEFDPELVIVSAGFDAAEGDMLGGCFVTPACYAHMTHMLMSLAGGKIAVCLEGGYNLRSIARSALAVTRTLMGEPPERLPSVEPSPSAVNVVQMVMRQQSRFWRCMYPKDLAAGLKERTGGERMHDIVRAWQSKVLYDEYGMSPLFILRERISKSYENQVLATPNFSEARPLLVIFHDPPDVMGVPDPRTNKLELHNTWLTDVAKIYVDWAVKRGFGVVDVNIPKHVTNSDDDGAYVGSEGPENNPMEAREVANYLWENYIELSDATHIFLMGIGAAYSSIIDLLSTIEGCTETITHVFAFVANNPLQAVRRLADDSISSWYWSHSSVFIAHDHAAMDPERQRKPRRKYGHLIQSPDTEIPQMLATHHPAVCETLEEESNGWQEMAEQMARQAKAAAEPVVLSSQSSAFPLPGRSSALTSPTTTTFKREVTDELAGPGPASNSAPKARTPPQVSSAMARNRASAPMAAPLASTQHLRYQQQMQYESPLDQIDGASDPRPRTMPAAAAASMAPSVARELNKSPGRPPMGWFTHGPSPEKVKGAGPSPGTGSPGGPK